MSEPRTAHAHDPSQIGIAPPQGRLPAATRLGVVRLQVADLDRSLAWYRRVLGLQAQRTEAGVVALAAADDAAPLIELHEHPGATPVPRHGRLGLYHFALLLPSRPDLGAFVRHLADQQERAGASDHGVSEALYLQDPDGLGIEVYADRPRDTWTVTDRQIRMETLPLDLADLVGAAGAQSWQGMPAGSTVGHLHLHVADLDEADAYYHGAVGLDRVVWSYPGALFLSAGGYHHHVGLNTWSDGPAAGDGDARLLEWELLVPTQGDVQKVAASLRRAGHAVEVAADGVRARDPWGTVMRLAATA